MSFGICCCFLYLTILLVESKLNWNWKGDFTGPYINYLTFNNGLHAVHHLHPTLHWSKLPSAHARLVSAQSHPNLNQPCMATYMFKAYVSPGKRVDYTIRDHLYRSMKLVSVWGQSKMVTVTKKTFLFFLF